MTRLRKASGLATFAFVASTFVFPASASASASGDGDGAEPVLFEHDDWELVCDNTRTCRAAGYQAEDGSLPVSVLFTRRAGQGTAVDGEVALGDGTDETTAETLPADGRLVLRIDGHAQGAVAMDRNATSASLAPAQVAALLRALTRDSLIEFVAGDTTWTLSDRGATAVLLKMDDVQGRVGTAGALVRRGQRPDTDVPPPIPAPVVRAAALHPGLPGDTRLLGRHDDALRRALRATVDENDCIDLHDEENPQPLELVRLTRTKLLVSTRCWLAAYNAGSGYWVIDERPPFAPVRVTLDATDFADGVLSAGHKSRGLGDCWTSKEWIWDGTRFVVAGEATTGQCRGFPGGAWTLPLRVSDVIRASR